MCVVEGSDETLESQNQSHRHQVPTDSVGFFSRTPQSPTAGQHNQTQTDNCSSFVQSPNHQGIPINFPSQNCNHGPYLSYLPNSGGGSVTDSAVQLSAGPSNLTSLNELDFQLMNIDPNMSPSSGVTSPMDLGFTNIGDEQSMDNIDLNNITPSIKLASSGPSDFSPGGSNSGGVGNTGNRRSQPLIKSKKSEDDESFGGSKMPSASCPVENSGTAYLSAERPLESPTNALSIPRIGGGGNASGGSGASSLTGTWGGSSIVSLSGAPNLSMLSSSATSSGNQRVALIKARSKKDSHNRIERKRRDYINCQITELGALLPEEMFCENDSKKNKGNILKNSVEYVAALQRESACYSGLYNETNIANVVIDRLVKRIQDLESLLPQEYLAKVTPIGTPDYRQMLQEWSTLHDVNKQKISLGTPVAVASQVSVDTSESSPELSSVGNNDDVGTCTGVRGDSNSPIPLIGQLGRTRCTSASSAHPMSAGVANGVEGAALAAPPLVGSLPSRGTRLLPASSPPNSVHGSGRPTLMHPLFSQLYASSGGTKPPSPSSGRIASKRAASGRPSAAKMEESGSIVVPNRTSVFSTDDGGSVFGGLSTSLPVRMALDEFPSTSDMNTDEPYLHMNSASVEGHRCEERIATTFKPEPIMEVTCGQAASFHAHSYQSPQFSDGGDGGGSDGFQPMWMQRLPRPLSSGRHRQTPAENSPTRAAGDMPDEV